MFYKILSTFIIIIITQSATFANTSYVDIYDEVDRFLELTEKYDSADDDSFLPSFLANTKKEVNIEINDFLDKLLIILTNNEAYKFKNGIKSLTEENNKINEEIAELSLKQHAAASEKKFYEIWKQTQEDMRAKIAELRKRLENNNLQIELNREKIVAFLQSSGVNLNQDEINSLLKTVTIYDFVDTITVLKTAHAVIANLKQSLEKENENIYIARKYYGIFWLSTKVYSRQLQRFTDQIEKAYLPNLEKIRVKNNVLMEETRQLVVQNPALKSNLKAQKLTNEAITIYKKVLLQQLATVNKQKIEVNKILRQAENTYKTVKIAHSLYQSMDASISSYNAIMSLPLIEIVPFKNTSIELKIVELTQQLHK